MIYTVYIECWINNRDKAIEVVCETFTTIHKHWIKAFAPTMTHKSQYLTSSSHLHKVQDE